MALRSCCATFYHRCACGWMRWLVIGEEALQIRYVGFERHDLPR